jgi:hypothetical protein
MPFEANNTMIYIRNITIRTAKSAPYLGNVGSVLFGAGHCRLLPFILRRLCAAVRYIKIPLTAPSLVVVN